MKDKAIRDTMVSIENRVRDVYNQGYHDGMADGFHEAIANGIPVINGTELASLLIDMRISGELHDCTFIVPRRDDNHINEVVVKRYKAKEALRQKPKSEWQQDHEILKAYSDGASEMLDTIRAEIEQTEIDGHIRDVECFRAGINVALNVINKYEPESKETQSKSTDEKINIGDEVTNGSGRKGVVVGIVTVKGEIMLSLLMREHKVPQLVKASNYETKTGRHFPQIAEVLERIKGEADGK